MKCESDVLPVGSCCVGGLVVCASKLCMFPIEKYGAKEKSLFQGKPKKRRLLFNDTTKWKNGVNLSSYLIIKSSTCYEKELLTVLLAQSLINRHSSHKRKARMRTQPGDNICESAITEHSWLHMVSFKESSR